MKPQWTNHLKDPDEKARFKSYIYNSRTLLDRQLEILQAMENDLDAKETTLDQYDSPSWAARQADLNGYRRCLREVRQIITLDPKDK